MNAMKTLSINHGDLGTSLQRLGGALRINSAADDASGMIIANKLRAQNSVLLQAIKNANDAIGITQIAEGAMSQQVKIVNTIKIKATMAAQDGQSSDSRAALQKDITNLLKELDTIASVTSFNGMQLLSGSYTNKQFQVGAYSAETIMLNIGDTTSAKIGSVRFETSNTVSTSIAAASNKIKITNIDGTTTTIGNVTVSTSAGTGLGVLAEAINRHSEKTGVRAAAVVESTASASVRSGNISNLVINNYTIGAIASIKDNDADGKLVNAINAATSQTGVKATMDRAGRLSIDSLDGRGIIVAGLNNAVGGFGTGAGKTINFGRMTYSRLGAGDIIISGGANGVTFNTYEFTSNLRSIAGSMSAAVMAGGLVANGVQSGALTKIGAGVTTRLGAMMVIDIAQSALSQLSKIRANIGATNNQLHKVESYASVTSMNAMAAESQIRDADFAEESFNFSKSAILMSSVSYMLSQANTLQKNVLRLLQL